MNDSTKEKLVRTLVVSWDSSDLVVSQFEGLIEDTEEELGRELTQGEKDRLFEDVCSDSGMLQMVWDDEMYCLTEKMKEINPDGVWYAEVEGFGWRGQSGCKAFEATTGEAFMNSILPRTDCTFNVYEQNTGDGIRLAINNFHHDSPTGKEWYYVGIAHKCERCGYIVSGVELTEDDDYGMICKECVSWVN